MPRPRVDERKQAPSVGILAQRSPSKMSPKGLAGSASVPTFAQPVGGASLKMNEYTVNEFK